MRNWILRAAALLSAAVMALSCVFSPALAAELSEAGERAPGSDAVRLSLTDPSAAETATVMVYMIGSDLESFSGLASDDLSEMMSADLGENVRLVVQTMGCSEWKNDQIRPDTAQRFTIEGGKLVLQDDTLGQLDSTDPETLTDFIRYCSDTYPADRNILILWDHGAGPVYGFGYDEYQPMDASLTLDEIQSALFHANITFDFIGMDACLMSSLETCCALWRYADYLVASEDFEPCDGWGYENWLTALGQNPAIPTAELGGLITSAFVEESNRAGEDGVLSMINLNYTGLISAAWADFAFANDSALTSANYSWKTVPTSRINMEESGQDRFNMDDYYITDIEAVAATVNRQDAAVLSSLLSSAIVACGTTEGDRYMTGLSVTLPYGNSGFYAKLSDIFLSCGFDETYLEWLGTFADALDCDVYYDNWDEWKDAWDSWDTCQTDEDAAQNWLDGQDDLNGIIDWDASDSTFNSWYQDPDTGLYFYPFPNGDMEYQDPNTCRFYYYTASGSLWTVWSLRTWSWLSCPDPGYPTDLQAPVG